MYSGERLLQLTGFQWQKTSRWDLKKMQRDSVWIDRVSHYIKKGSAICFQPRIWGLNTKNTELQRVHDGLNRDYNLIKILHRGKSCFDNDLRVQLVKWAAWECFVLAGVSTIRTWLQTRRTTGKLGELQSVICHSSRVSYTGYQRDNKERVHYSTSVWAHDRRQKHVAKMTICLFHTTGWPSVGIG